MDVQTSDNETIFFEILSRFTKRSSNQKLDTQKTILNFEKSGEIINYDFFLLQSLKKSLPNSQTSRNIKYSVNISAKTLKKADEIANLTADIAQFLIFEITETSDVDINEAFYFTQKMRFLGAEIAVDDINHSKQGLDLVFSLHPEYAKFVLPKNSNEYDSFFRLISKTVTFSPSSDIVVENIETAEEFALVSQMIPFALLQGYYFNTGETFIQGLRYN